MIENEYKLHVYLKSDLEDADWIQEDACYTHLDECPVNMEEVKESANHMRTEEWLQSNEMDLDDPVVLVTCTNAKGKITKEYYGDEYGNY